jgi:hypothetical protein
MTGHLDIKDLEKMKKDDLKALAKDMGISDEGTVKELAARIAAEEVEVPEEDELTEEEKEAVKAAEDEEVAEEPPKVSETDTAQENKKKVTVRVIQTYKDKKAKQVFRPGFECSISLKRAKELEAAKVAEIVTK